MSDIKHGVLVANTVKTEVMDAYQLQLTVQSKDRVEIWFTVDGSTPTVGGEDVYFCENICVVPGIFGGATTTVKMLSTKAGRYTVKAEDAV